MVGRTLSHYKVLSEISRGGMGIVYRALDTKLNREVAIKVLPPELVADQERKRRFVQEAQAAASLKHPNIAVIYGIDESDGTTFIAMELIEGEKLRDLLATERLPATRALDIAIEVAEGLARAHEKGIVHRDLKPANIMMDADAHPKIIDFGLAKLLEPLGPVGSDVTTALRGETESGRLLGTISYMSPEQASGEAVDHRSDIFSFGVVLQEMLTGEHPFQGATNVDILHAILRSPAPRLSDKDSRHQPFLDKCLAKDLADRYQTMKDVVIALRELREGLQLATSKPSVTAHTTGHRWPSVAVAGLVVTVVGLVWFLFRDTPRPGLSETGRPTVAVLNFESHGGEDDEEIRWLSQGLPNMLLTDLAQTPGLDVVSSQRIHEILEDVGQENVDAIDKSVIADIASRAGAGAVVVGSIFKHGEEIRIDVQLEDIGSGRVLAAESVRGEDLFSLVDQLSERIRSSLEITDQPAGRPIADVTTDSLEAFQLYSEGLTARANVRWVDARRLLEEAVKIDPWFAMAYFELSIATRRLGQSGDANRHLEKALQHIDRLPDRQVLLVQAVHAWEIDGDANEAIRLLEDIVSLYPDEEEAYNQLQGFYRDLGRFNEGLAAAEQGVKALPNSGILRNTYGYELIWHGRYTDAIREFQKYSELNPNEANPHDSLAEAYLISGQPERALEEYAKTLELDPSFYLSHQSRGWAFGMLGLFDETLVEWGKVLDLQTREGVPPTEILFLNALAQSRSGRYREAEASLRKGIHLATSGDDFEIQAQLELLYSAISLERHDYAKALASTARAERLFAEFTGEAQHFSTLIAHLLGGTAEARVGDTDAARDRLDIQEGLYNYQSVWENWFYHALAGAIALAEGDLAAAESAFLAGEPEGKMWFSMGQVRRSAFSNSLPFRDGLARVNKAQGELTDAIQIYRKLNEPGLDSKWVSMMEPRYVLEVARLLDETGDKEAARAEYERFLELWKNADEGLPELAEARAYLGE